MMRTLAQTGNGWMTFKDASNAVQPDRREPGNVVHLSNLCTEIIEVTSDAETAVCNLGSINLARHLTPTDGRIRLGEARATPCAPRCRYLDRVIDINFYPSGQAAASNPRWRPVGLGVMGLQDVFFKLRLPFDSPEARELSTRIAEEIYFTRADGVRRAGRARRRAPGVRADPRRRGRAAVRPLGRDRPTWPRWDDAARARSRQTGLRNSLLIAIAPTATIASIAGCYECIEPQVSNLFKRETLSGEFLQVNRYLVAELKELGLWTTAVRDAIKRADGSVQEITRAPGRASGCFTARPGNCRSAR